MAPREKIIAEFTRIEKSHGGYTKIGAKAVCIEVANLLGITLDEVRRVMIDEWGMKGG